MDENNVQEQEQESSVLDELVQLVPAEIRRARSFVLGGVAAFYLHQHGPFLWGWLRGRFRGGR